ncbi:MAG: AbrB/MazE/SpoVT family DNA-binding domain-containing protein [Pseudorhodoplanes sp.]|nr:AbrB/MazE/SpoVT family DNA-binding domain-containing protein [Pseudorhodoplanes sp.]
MRRLVIPASTRAALDIKPGDKVIIQRDGKESGD